jgi:hypothetical protein
MSVPRGRLHLERDAHVHLGGSISRDLIQRWIRDGELAMDTLLHDFVAGGRISVRDALIRYRRGLSLAEAYQQPYKTLDVFLTMYGAYSRRELVLKNAALIARTCICLKADVRQSVLDPLGSNAQLAESDWAGQALSEMQHIRRCLMPDQRLVITFPRQCFSRDRHFSHFKTFIAVLKAAACAEPSPQSWFDFSGQELRVEQILPLLRHLRQELPNAYICYHHGELCQIALHHRVADAERLLPLINRMGHAVCLGVAIDEAHSDPALAQRARQCLVKMAHLGIGVEVNPSCNLSLGGATSLSYVKDFLDAGVDVYVGSDDPGFLGTTMEKEREILVASAVRSHPSCL